MAEVYKPEEQAATAALNLGLHIYSGRLGATAAKPA